MKPSLCAVVLMLPTYFVPAAGAFDGEFDKQVLAQQARAILKANCHRCHGENGANEGGFNYVIDLRQLVGRRRVLPGDSAKSKIMRRINHPDDPMPPAEEKIRPSAGDVALLKKWIAAGAPPVDEAPQRAFVSPADMVEAMRDDLDRASPRDRPFLRYFTLTHLHNAGLSDEELQSYRHGLSKLVNSLSWGRRIVVPRPIDAAQTILRIDLRAYQWNARSWEAILVRNPYGVVLDSEAAKACADLTRCRLPYVRGDWFVALGSRPPLYHDILDLPKTEGELEKLLRVDVVENIRQELVARAGFNGSGVSRNNRLIERHESGATVYWKSYDFGGNTGRQNLFAHPLGPESPSPLGGEGGVRGNTSFRHDGGEIIFSLPNGLQAYFLADAKGQRIDKGPTAIVSDPRRPDRAVENGLSCISCHARGIIEKTDQIRAHVLKNPKAFSESTVETMLALYPPSEKLTDLMRADAKRFQAAVAQTGAPLSATEPIAALAMRFETELDLPLAAAEAGVKPRELLKTLERFPHLAQQLGALRVEGGIVQRQVFVDAFGDLVDVLKQGSYVASRNVAADKLLRLGNSLSPSDPPAAIRAFSEALQLDPLSAHLFNNRGLVFHRRGEHDKAVADYDSALRLDPRFTVAYLNRGVTHYAKGQLDRAIADYTEALRLDDKSSLAFNNRGYALLDKGETDRAIADFDQALRLDAKFAAAWSNRGLAFLRKSRPDQAVADLTMAIQLNPNLAQAYFNRSVAFTRLGDALRAGADRTKAIEFDPTLDKD